MPLTATCIGARQRPFILGGPQARRTLRAAMASSSQPGSSPSNNIPKPMPAIVQAGTPVLRQVAREVPPELLGSEWLRNLVATMTSVMRAAPGVGLAAPQIGEPWRVIVLEDREEYIVRQAASGMYDDDTLAAMERRAFGPLVLVNPRGLRPVGHEGAAFFEGCLSVRGYVAVVPRYRIVELEAVDPAGLPVVVRASGWMARILQHEFDHLQGILYVDRMAATSFATSENLGQWVRSLPAGVGPLGRCTCCHPIDRLA
ncbi:hypothetical protein VOLCADRAFT_120388 [Volvox carteri f. nagariensis]|uniref:Peptide deformylase n=1 Tax=Volvox carteri f. nagariensis TaxID=3068 RepID=D8TK74_VOLCA|nr:uncharacterized protein VOLCADRAFT_120388 [Volvox carteri f. nagariensis]EFJ52012.1 hypothetical protein VOLCADRAFT_120388 [Volvox carteri f. nagariensis]|eukprot:XP_002946786.1 hypothetical protein VOLCADRAFT_120388 [Volvox carteri f. nagariensis]